MTTEMQPTAEVSTTDVHERFETWLNSEDEPASDEPEAVEGEAVESEQAEDVPESEESDEDQTDDEEEAEDSEDEVETLTLDGEEVTLPKDVAQKVTTIKKRLEADYTRKTQEAAEMRKSAEALQQRVQQDVEFHQQNTDLLVEWQTIDSQLKDYDGVDWAALAEQDISAYSKHKEIRDGLRLKQQQVGSEFQQRQQFIEHQKAEETKQRLAKTVETVTHAIPDYFEKYDNKVTAVAEGLAAKYGMTLDKAQLKQLSQDPLVVLGLVELSKYQDLTAKRPATTNKVASAPPPPKVSVKSQKSSQSREAKIQKLLSQGRIREASQL